MKINIVVNGLNIKCSGMVLGYFMVCCFWNCKSLNLVGKKWILIVYVIWLVWLMNLFLKEYFEWLVVCW